MAAAYSNDYYIRRGELHNIFHLEVYYMTTATAFLQGQKAFLSRNWQESIKAFSLALDEGIHPVQAQLNRGIACLKSGQFIRALSDFDAVIGADGGHDLAFFYRGIAWLNQGEPGAALEDLDRSLALNPARGAAHLARGLAHHVLGHKVEEERDIHAQAVLHDVELSEFMEEYIISEPLFEKILAYFANDDAVWNLSLTADEAERLNVTIH